MYAPAAAGGGAAAARPVEYMEFQQALLPAERGNPLLGYYRRLLSPDGAEREAAVSPRLCAACGVFVCLRCCVCGGCVFVCVVDAVRCRCAYVSACVRSASVSVGVTSDGRPVMY